MQLYAQHGYGKSDKIERGLRQNHLTGVILSPKDEPPNRMLEYVSDLRNEFDNNSSILFDPQFYVTTIVLVRDGNLPDYPYYQPGLTRAQFIAQTDIHGYVDDVLNYQLNLNLDRMISPSVLFEGFSDPWSQISLSMAQESITVHDQFQLAPPLLLSLVMDEVALRNRDGLDEFLDIISIWNVTGFYLLVRRNSPGYPALFDESTLANLMYLVYVLAEVNDFEVICGYSDLVGTLLGAVGAEGIGSGWYNTLRQFSYERFRPRTGGRPRRDRYTSIPLLNSILVVPELDTAFRLGALAHVISNTSYDSVMQNNNPANAPWPLPTACLHHWECLSRLSSQISSRSTTLDRLTFFEDLMHQARGIYRLLEGAGMVFDTLSGPNRLDLWLRSIRSFRMDAGI